ncbi:unnamed protein product [[Candida] boidinii]|nr:unnamed protein product [[Candida] boidinii]
MCGFSDGVFLDFIEAKLVELEWPESDKDIMQCINCRYGIDVAIDNWFPIDHEAPETDLTKLSAVRLSHYILSYCFRKKHPVLKLPTNDIKTLIEYIYEVLGDPDANNEIISRNYSSIEMFLSTRSLDVRTMKFAFYGLLNVDLEMPTLEFRRSIDEGLYYLQALVGFSAFKAKKRNMQSRVADLDSVIALLKSDIACGSNRLESWLLLGQAYSAFVEDDMIWTADKLNNPEKKNITAFMQKQALLCYLKAIDIYAHLNNEKKENLRLVLRVCGLALNGQKTYEAVSTNPITAEAIYKILRIAFLMSAKLNSNSWSSLYYLSKVDSKDKSDIDSVFEILLKSCSLVPKVTSRDDPILEPHYRLCSLLYKRVMSNSISIEAALEYLKRDSILEVDAENVNNKDDFANIIIMSLKKIKRLDRSSWHHKPIYRIAKILDDHFGDVSGAIKEMSEIITIKPTKSLCAIWKPENERPGKHFVYIYDYIKFYVELLDKTNDIEALFSLCRRLRRLGANMIQHLKLWEYSVGISCTRIKETVFIPKGYVDLVLPNLVYSDFIDISKKFLKDVSDSKDYSPQERILFYFLSEISEFRRMANGFGPTSFIDEVYHSLYLKLYLDYEKSHSAFRVVEVSNAESSDTASLLKSEEILKSKTPGTPSKEKVRVARRDIMPLCAQLLGIVQKEVDKIKKDIADVS